MGPKPMVTDPPENVSRAFSYGQYFDAVTRFLTWDGCRRLFHALERHFNESVESNAIQQIRIFLVKHGEFYHPSRIDLELGSRKASFVLNVAVSETGRGCLDTEVDSLGRLSRHAQAAYIPKVYAKGEVSSQGRADLKMWLGEWFDGFHEFHWSSNSDAEGLMLAVWDPHTTARYLALSQAGNIYCEAAAILTHFYNLTTFEQIYPWHHGAGDFIVRTRIR